MLKLFIRKKKASLEHAEEEIKKTLDNSKVDALERMVGLLEKIDANTNNPQPTTVNVSSAAVKKIAKQTSEEIGFIPSINTVDNKSITKKKTTSKKRNISSTAKKLKETK